MVAGLISRRSNREAVPHPRRGDRVQQSAAIAPAKAAYQEGTRQKFRELLEEKRRAVLDRARKTLTENMTLDPSDLPDEMDLASAEYNQSFEFRLRGRDKSLLSKLELAIKKIDDGTFGTCESCEEPIGKKRLEARPETSLCIRCKEDQEREERTLG
jgi:DnaK suppressor protein